MVINPESRCPDQKPLPDSQPMIQVLPVSETSLIIRFGDEIDIQRSETIGLFAQHVRNHFSEVLLEVIPSYTSILIEYHPLRTCFEVLQNEIIALADSVPIAQTETREKTIELPVYYSEETGPDLSKVAEQHGLSVSDVIRLHSQKTLYSLCHRFRPLGLLFLPAFLRK